MNRFNAHSKRTDDITQSEMAGVFDRRCELTDAGLTVAYLSSLALREGAYRSIGRRVEIHRTEEWPEYPEPWQMALEDAARLKGLLDEAALVSLIDHTPQPVAPWFSSDGFLPGLGDLFPSISLEALPAYLYGRISDPSDDHFGFAAALYRVTPKSEPSLLVPRYAYTLDHQDLSDEYVWHPLGVITPAPWGS